MFLWQILHARDNKKADNYQKQSGAITKPTQNQVHSNQNHNIYIYTMIVHFVMVS